MNKKLPGTQMGLGTNPWNLTPAFHIQIKIKKKKNKEITQFINLLQNKLINTFLGLPSCLYIPFNIPLRSCRTHLCEMLPDFNFH